MNSVIKRFIYKLKAAYFFSGLPYFTSVGIGFYYKKTSSEVIWLYPKNRINNRKYFDVISGDSFYSLQQLQQYWNRRMNEVVDYFCSQ
jgi:hypothetical protein